MTLSERLRSSCWSQNDLDEAATRLDALEQENARLTAHLAELKKVVMDHAVIYRTYEEDYFCVFCQWSGGKKYTHDDDCPAISCTTGGGA